MRKPCSICRTVMNAEAPYCDACGSIFPEPRVSLMAPDLKIFISALAMIAVAVILVGFLRVR